MHQRVLAGINNQFERLSHIQCYFHASLTVKNPTDWMHHSWQAPSPPDNQPLLRADLSSSQDACYYLFPHLFLWRTTSAKIKHKKNRKIRHEKIQMLKSKYNVIQKKVKIETQKHYLIILKYCYYLIFTFHSKKNSTCHVIASHNWDLPAYN